jgi:hypothetical protein
MTDLLPEMQRARTARNLARTSLDGDVARVKADLAARGVGGRIADKATDTATEALAVAIEVADNNRAVVAGTIAALGVWFMRRPIIRLAGRAFGSRRKQDEDFDDE